jgi:hypothetical protein
MGDYSDADLLAYIDGAVPPDIAALIEGSPELMDRVRVLRHLQGSLLARLFRADCPGPHSLGEYYLGSLPASQMSMIRQHMQHCPHCAAELLRLESFMAPGLFERGKVVVAALLGSDPSASLTPAAAVRGEEAGPRIYLAGGMQVILETQSETRRPERRSMTGLVTGRPAGEMEVQLIAGDLPPLSVHAGDMGDFQFSGLTPGVYTLRLLTTEEEIQIPAFAIE